MDCQYYFQQQCQSCSLLHLSYPETLEIKFQQFQNSFQKFLSHVKHPPLAVSPLRSMPDAEKIFPFRNKAKMVVSGSAMAPLLGILAAPEKFPSGQGIDLAHCPLYYPTTHRLLERMKIFIRQYQLHPYQISARKGELKYLLIHESPLNGEIMLRFVLQDKKTLSKIRPGLPGLQKEFPQIKVISANIQPVHQAIIEGPEEIYLTPQNTIEHVLGPYSLTLSPQCFFQTNSLMALELYQEARQLIAKYRPPTLLDLYCGVGGFSFAAIDLVEEGWGIEISQESIRCALLTQEKWGEKAKHWRFTCGDITEMTAEGALLPVTAKRMLQNFVVINPPRSGLRESVCRFLLQQGPTHILYSSCNTQTLIRDLHHLSSSYRVEFVRPFDMFPFTPHLEILVLLVKTHLRS